MINEDSIIIVSNSLFTYSRTIVKEIVKQILSDIKDGHITIDLILGHSNDKSVYISDNKIILSKAEEYDYHNNVYTDFKPHLYSDDKEDVRKLETCVNLLKIYSINS